MAKTTLKTLSSLIKKRNFKIAFLDKLDIINATEDYICLITTPQNNQALPKMRLEIYNNQILQQGEYIYLIERAEFANQLKKVGLVASCHGLSTIYIADNQGIKIVWGLSLITILGLDHDTFAPIIKLGPPPPPPQFYINLNINAAMINNLVQYYSNLDN